MCRQIKTWDCRAGRAGGVNMATAGTNNNTNNTQPSCYHNNTTTVPASTSHFTGQAGAHTHTLTEVYFMSTSTIRRETKRALPIGWHWSSGEKQHSSNSAGTLRQTSGNKLTGGAATQGCFIIVLGFSC